MLTMFSFLSGVARHYYAFDIYTVVAYDHGVGTVSRTLSDSLSSYSNTLLRVWKEQQRGFEMGRQIMLFACKSFLMISTFISVQLTLLWQAPVALFRLACLIITENQNSAR